MQQTLEESAALASRISQQLGGSAAGVVVPRVTRGLVESAAVDAQKPAASRQRQWIDLAHDVTLGDAELAVREGFVPVEHFKRYTTTGMSLDQGKTGNLNAYLVLAALTGRNTAEVGTTTFRPPYVPVTLGALAGIRSGELYAPRRLLPAHRVHQRLQGRFEDYGWQRPDCYPLPGESLHDAKTHLHVSGQGGKALQGIALAARDIADDLHVFQQGPVTAAVTGYFKRHDIQSPLAKSVIVEGQGSRGGGGEVSRARNAFWSASVQVIEV